MTVGELITELLEFDKDAEVIQSSDPEGNGFCPLSAVFGGRRDRLGWFVPMDGGKVPTVCLWPGYES